MEEVEEAGLGEDAALFRLAPSRSDAGKGTVAGTGAGAKAVMAATELVVRIEQITGDSTAPVTATATATASSVHLLVVEYCITTDGNGAGVGVASDAIRNAMSHAPSWQRWSGP